MKKQVLIAVLREHGKSYRTVRIDSDYCTKKAYASDCRANGYYVTCILTLKEAKEIQRFDRHPFDFDFESTYRIIKKYNEETISIIGSTILPELTKETETTENTENSAETTENTENTENSAETTENTENSAETTENTENSAEICYEVRELKTPDGMKIYGVFECGKTGMIDCSPSKSYAEKTAKYYTNFMKGAKK